MKLNANSLIVIAVVLGVTAGVWYTYQLKKKEQMAKAPGAAALDNA